MSAPPPSHLDSNQILPSVYDEATGALRVETNIATIMVGGSQIIEITDAQDSIKIGNGSGVFAGVTEGGLNVYDVPAVTFQTSQYTVGTSAVAITGTPLANRAGISLKASTTGANIIYIGNSAGVTTSTGYPLQNDDAINMDISSAQAIWAIATAAGQTLSALELA